MCSGKELKSMELESRLSFAVLINGMARICVWDWVEMQGTRVSGRG